MRIVKIVYSQMIVTHAFLDDAKAQEAYDKLQAAMAAFRPYGNDKDATVSFSDNSGTATVRIDAVASVVIDGDDESLDAIVRADAERVKRMQTIRDSISAPVDLAAQAQQPEAKPIP